MSSLFSPVGVTVDYLWIGKLTGNCVRDKLPAGNLAFLDRHKKINLILRQLSKFALHALQVFILFSVLLRFVGYYFEDWGTTQICCSLYKHGGSHVVQDYKNYSLLILIVIL